MSSIRKQIAMCVAGTLLEFYDFSIFAALTTIISAQFFSHEGPERATFYTLLVFASGFFTRPLGAIFFGHLGDKAGRRSTLIISIFLITASTAAIGLLPTQLAYSPFLLIVCRLLQGFAASGEYAGGITLLSEQNSRHKGFFSSFGIFSACMGIFLGALICALVTKIIGDKAMMAWGWRIPFLLSIVIGIGGLIIRAHLNESQLFIEAQRQQQLSQFPFWKILKEYKKTIFTLFFFFVFTNVVFYVNFSYFNVYLLATHKLLLNDSLLINALVTLFYSLMILGFGYLSDYYGRKVLIFLSCVLMVIFIYPLFQWILTGTFLQILLGQFGIALLTGMFAGPLGALAAELFTTDVRFSGVGFTLNTSAAIFGGTTPVVCSLLVSRFHNPYAPAYYVMLITFFAFCSLAVLGYKEFRSGIYPRQLLEFAENSK